MADAQGIGLFADSVVKEVSCYWRINFDEAFVLWVDEVFFLGIFY